MIFLPLIYWGKNKLNCLHYNLYVKDTSFLFSLLEENVCLIEEEPVIGLIG